MLTADEYYNKHSDNIMFVLNKHGIACPRCGFSIGPGWLPIVDRAFGKMIAHGWDRGLAQVKEKWCTLRIYIDDANDEIDEDIREAEAECDRTCEECGQSRELDGPRTGAALCSACQKKYDSKFDGA